MLKNVCYSLSDLLGVEYVEKVALAQAFIQNQDSAKFLELAHGKVEFYPDGFARRADELALKSGEKICDSLDSRIKGAPTNSFGQAQHSNMSPLSGLGCTRIGEDGRAYFIGKSEHYHTSLGHQFPGYQLLDYAHQLGILNATHNNTRGYITRLAEREIVRVANQITRGDESAIDASPLVCASERKKMSIGSLIPLERTGGVRNSISFMTETSLLGGFRYRHPGLIFIPSCISIIFNAVYFSSNCLIMLLCSGARCCITTKATFTSRGMPDRNPSIASSPPADAPIPTIGKRFLFSVAEISDVVFLLFFMEASC